MPRRNHPDPGGIFDSDDHRRVLAHLGDVASDGYQTPELLERLGPDVGTSFDEVDELIEVLKDLEADRFAREGQHGWYMTRTGLRALTGPNGRGGGE